MSVRPSDVTVKKSNAPMQNRTMFRCFRFQQTSTGSGFWLRFSLLCHSDWHSVRPCKRSVVNTTFHQQFPPNVRSQRPRRSADSGPASTLLRLTRHRLDKKSTCLSLLISFAEQRSEVLLKRLWHSLAELRFACHSHQNLRARQPSASEPTDHVHDDHCPAVHR